jgi:thiamine biosynthesis lipoprotein
MLAARPAMPLRFVIMICAALALAVVASCSASTGSSDLRFVEQSTAAMGSELRLGVWTTKRDAAEKAFTAALDEVDRLEDAMSNWIEDSDIQKLNAAAGANPVPVNAEVRELLHSARQISEWTDGKFDVTFAALSGLWKFDYQNKDGIVPDRQEIAPRLKLIDYRDLVIDDSAGTAFLRRPGMAVGLGGIGKGYAIDRVKDILRRSGFSDFMIQFGGDLYVGGRSGDRPWSLGIQDPRGPADKAFAAVSLSDSTFSTSGDYERYFFKDGRRYHHILDPATGEPARGCRSVTIVAGSATIADGLSTGVFILGPEAGMALIERLPEVEGVIVSGDNRVLVSSGLEKKLTQIAPPTDAP